MKARFRLFFTAAFFLFITVPCSAQIVEEIEMDDNGGEVMSLFEIERLIRKTDYTEALKQLNIYIDKKPDYFDNAQRLIKIIMNRRKQYSVLAERAIKSSTENPEDHETPAKIILQMRSIEKNPPAEIKHMIDMLEEMHLFKYYAYLFDSIQEQSARLTMEGNYNAAISLVQEEGFDIYKDEYYDTYENDNPQMADSATRIMTSLEETLARYRDNDLQKEFDTAVSQFMRAVRNDDYSEANSLFASVESVFNRYAQVRNEVYDCGQQIKALYEKQKELDSEITDASYLPFMQRFILGVASPEYSGILGAIDGKYWASLEEMKNLLAGQVLAHSNTYLNDLPQVLFESAADYDNLSDSLKYVLPVSRYAELGKKTNALYALLDTDSSQAYAPYPGYDISLDYESSLCQKTADLMGITREFEKEKNTQEEIIARGIQAVSQLFDSVFRMSTILGAKSQHQTDNFEWGRAYNQLDQEEDNGRLDWTEHTQRYALYLETLFNLSASSMTDSWTLITESYKNDSDNYLAQTRDYKEKAAVYSKGFDQHMEESVYNSIKNDMAALLEYAQKAGAQNNPAYMYPDLAEKMYEHSRGLAASYSEELTQKQNTLTQNLNEHEDWLQNQSLVAVVDAAVAYIQNKKAELELNRVQALQGAQDMALVLEEAAYSKNYADSLISASYDALARENLTEAENLLLEASEKFADSLALYDDIELREKADSIKVELSTKIMDAKNEIVVKESRRLYTEARDALNYDRYEDSESLINAAINKWAETHTEKNPEFEDFRELVNTAVSMKTGRVLLPSDPLYSEMSQLLSIAYQYYNEGEQLMKAGNKENANIALDSAIENLNKFKAVYPLNQEASLLMLKVDRLRDPARFDEEFAQKVQTAIAQSKKKDTMAQAYNTLTDYYNLVPNYKGLKDVIYNLEIELGMRQRPVDNSAATRSSRLTTQAQTQFNRAGNNTGLLNQALNTVNEALKLNPNNKAAQTLKDNISLKLGSSSIIVLSSDDQNLLTQAKKAYQAGNIDEANTYMLRLLNNNPNNIKLKEVEDLNNKIRSQL